MTQRKVLGAVLYVFLAVGCAAEGPSTQKEPLADTFTQLGLHDDGKDDAFTSRFRTLTTITAGQTKSHSYSGRYDYVAYRFYPEAGDHLVADVRSEDGDPVAWLLDSSYEILAMNDDTDASAGNYNSHVEATAADDSRHYIVFRDYGYNPAHFSTTLNVTSSTPTGCDYGGEHYDEGDTFPATDGCNSCSCTSGHARCTTRACPSCDPAHEPNHEYVSTSPSTCARIRYTCTAGSTPFSNDCGCGCERSSVTCSYNGHTYNVGDHFNATDGCNTCTCGSDGSADCTSNTCRTCDPAHEPNRTYAWTPEECTRIRYSCISGWHRFSNECGCGCERN